MNETSDGGNNEERPDDPIAPRQPPKTVESERKDRHKDKHNEKHKHKHRDRERTR